jgi:hypothetical protein
MRFTNDACPLLTCTLLTCTHPPTHLHLPQPPATPPLTPPHPWFLRRQLSISCDAMFASAEALIFAIVTAYNRYPHYLRLRLPPHASPDPHAPQLHRLCYRVNNLSRVVFGLMCYTSCLILGVAAAAIIGPGAAFAFFLAAYVFS